MNVHKGSEVEKIIYITDHFGVNRPAPDSLRRLASRYMRRADPKEIVRKEVHFM